MLKNILIYLIIFALFIFLLTDNKSINNLENFKITNDNNYVMNDKSIILSSNTNLNKTECFNKVNKKDINGASYNLINNTCTLYFFAEKGLQNKDVESII
jgi:hypothetical protein